MQEVTLYHALPSLCSQKVRLALAEKGVPYRAVLIDIGPSMENYEPWYMRMNPAGVVPTLRHGDRVVTDSARIIHYLDETFPGPPLLPKALAARDRIEALIARQDRLKIRELSYANVKGPLGVLVRRGVLGRVVRLEQKKAEAPELAAAYDAKIADVRAWNQALQEPSTIASLLEDVDQALGEVDEALARGPFLGGDAYSLADVVWTIILGRMRMLGLGRHVDRRPSVAAYYQRMRDRPSFAAAGLMDRLRPSVMIKILGRGLWQKLTGRGRRPR
ncbi:MAG: glutathione S-transferase family protein [Nannocystaceae bacterium]